MAELWDKRDSESTAAHQALRDYLHMGVRRSLSKLAAQYTRRASSKRAAKLPPTISLNTLETWSHNHDWVKRAKAYDIDQQKQDDAALVASRQKLIEAEIADANAELKRFRDMRNLVNISFKEQVSETKIDDPDNPGQKILVRTIVEHPNVPTNAALTKWRLEISALARRAHGMPEKITEAHIDDNIDAEKSYKAYIGISPDDWDEGEDSDDETDRAV